MDEYRPMATMGLDNAAMHVSNVMNIKRMETGTAGHVSIGDAAAAIRACE